MDNFMMDGVLVIDGKHIGYDDKVWEATTGEIPGVVQVVGNWLRDGHETERPAVGEMWATYSLYRMTKDRLSCTETGLAPSSGPRRLEQVHRAARAGKEAAAHCRVGRC